MSDLQRTRGIVQPETPDVAGAYPRLTDEQIQVRSRIGTRKSVEEGSALYRAGDHYCDFFVILSRSVVVLKETDDGAQPIATHPDMIPATPDGEDGAGSCLPSTYESARAAVFAVGDVRSGSVKRVARPSARGAVAVRLVHQFLENKFMACSSSFWRRARHGRRPRAP